MPIFEFYCDECEKPFEVIRKFSDGVPTQETCPHCGHDKTLRLLSTFEWIFRCSGFYRTDKVLLDQHDPNEG